MKLLPTLFCGITFAATYFSNQNSELTKSMARGKDIYVETCIACHLGKGEGVRGTFPPLAKSDYLVKDQARAISSIKFGLKGKIQVNGVIYNGVMPSPNISDDEIADVMNYILNSWGNVSKKPLITEKIVASVVN